jgi:hypothetical protein
MKCSSHSFSFIFEGRQRAMDVASKQNSQLLQLLQTQEAEVERLKSEQLEDRKALSAAQAKVPTIFNL